MAKATVYIHGGDYDCSELVRMCYRAVDVLPYGSYCWTGNEVSLLKSHGFKERSLSSPQVGDVLWRSGHTEIYLGDGMEGGARVSETGGINGRKGDQTGNEITRSAYDRGHWSKLLRYEGGKTVGGIPCAIAAALVADHIIDHSAHGYSQPNRAGDGTLEAVTIEWNGSKAAPKPIPCDVTVRVETDVLRIRSYPDTNDDGNIVGAYGRGGTVALDGIVLPGTGHVWGTYIGGTSGKRRYIALDNTVVV
jgi:hypothetical protein